MSSHICRVKEEAKELEVKCLKLTDFISNSDVFVSLDLSEQVRLIKQLGFMESYLDILDKRISCYQNQK